jgi:hypothetical protein
MAAEGAPANRSSRTARAIRQEIALSILLGGVAPFVIYSLLRPHTSELHALIIAAVAPLLENVLSLIRKRTLDIFGAFVLGGILISVALVLAGGSPKLILIRESFLTGATGLVFLLSLLYRRPLIYYFALHFNTGDNPQQRAEWSRYWAYPYFRFVMRLMTLVWGVATLAEALIRGYLVFHLSTAQFLAVSPFVQYGIIGATIAWTVWYGRRARRRGEQLRAAAPAAAGSL